MTNKNILLNKFCIVKENLLLVEKELHRLFPDVDERLDLYFSMNVKDNIYTLFSLRKGYFYVASITEEIYEELEKTNTKPFYEINLKDLKGLK